MRTVVDSGDTSPVLVAACRSDTVSSNVMVIKLLGKNLPEVDDLARLHSQCSPQIIKRGGGGLGEGYMRSTHTLRTY